METNLAVLIDFENIAAGTEKEGLGRFDVDALMKRITDKGRVLVARAYADWGRFGRFKQSLLMANVTMLELTSHGMQDKNRADIAMVVDALELAFTKDYIQTFVIVSGDSDFTPLVIKMRELDKRVIGCGTRSSTSRLLIEACDEFFFYDSIVEHKKNRPSRPVNTKKGYDLGEAIELLVDAIEGLQRENPEPPLASVVKSAMLRKSPDFTESDFKFTSFARFLEAAQEEGKVKVLRDQKSGGYRVDTMEGEREGVPARKAARDDAAGSEQWIDPYAPAEARPLIEALAADGYNPLSTANRMAVLDLLEQVVAERRKRRRRVNVQFVQDDVRKRMRKTHPDVPSRVIRNIFNALLRAQVFIHRDGTPTRTSLAPFTLDKDASEMNLALANVYLELLHEDGADLSDAELLAELFLGDRERRRKVEEILAWLHASGIDEPEDDFDALLSVEPTEDLLLSEVEALYEEGAELAPQPEPEDESAEEKPKKGKKSRGRKKKKSEAKKSEATSEDEKPEDEGSEDAAATSDGEDEAEEPAAAAEPAEEESPPKTKPKTRRNVRRKRPPAEEPPPVEGAGEPS